MNEIQFLATAFLCCVFGAAFYWNIAYPVLSKIVRYRLFMLRDAARKLASEHKLGQSGGFNRLDDFIATTVLIAPFIGLPSFAWHAATHQHREADPIGISGMPKEFSEIRDETSRCAIIMMMLNSPLTVLVAAVPVPILWAVGKISSSGLYRGAEGFVENVGSGSGDSVLCAA